MRFSTARFGKILAAGAAVAFAAAALPASAATSATTVNWAQDGLNKADSGYNAFETSITAATVANLKWQWAITSPVARPSCVGLGAGQRAPIVDNGHLAIADQSGFGVYDALTGAPQWHKLYDDPGEDFGPQMAATGSTLVTVPMDCRSEDPSTPLTAYDLATGAQLWRVFPATSISSFAIDGSVVVVTGDFFEGIATRGYSLATGAQLWERDDIGAPLAVDFAGKVLVTDGTSSTALNATTGATVWTVATAWTALAASADGSRVAVTDDAGQLAYLNGANGAVVWSKPNLADAPLQFTGGGKVSTDGTRVYTAHNGTLTALNATSGATVWTVSVGVGAGRPVVAGGVVYAPQAGQAEMLVLNATTGASLDGDTPYAGIVGHAVVVNGWMYVSNGRVLDAYRL